MTKREKRNNIMGYLFISPWLIGFFIFILFPIVASFVLAFTKYDILSPPKWVGISNWLRLLEDGRYHNSLRATFYYVFAAVPLRLIFALLIAMLLKPPTRMTSIYTGIYYLPSLIGGSVAVAIMWRQIFGIDGLINFILKNVGIEGINWLGNPSTAIWTLIILAVWQFGSPMLIFLAGLRQIPESLYEAASIDGAKAWAQFTNITIPMLSPVILFNLIMQIINGFMVFTQAYIITGGAPLDTTLFYALYLYQRAFQSFDMGYASAMAWVLLVIIAFFTILAFKSSKFWVYYESEEGK